MTTTPDFETGTELVAYHPPARTVDLRNAATDSWTDVLDEVITLSRGIANTEFVPKSLRGSVEKTTAAILYGRELGLPPMTGLGSTHVIEGKAGISAELMRALILQAGHELVVPTSTREKCVIRGRRKGSEEWTEAVWTIQEANQTKVFISKDKGWGPLSSKAQWQSWPTEMLLARATTRLARMLFPDVISGMRSTEELQDMTETVEAEVVPVAPEVQSVQRRRMQRPAPKPAPVEESVAVAEAVEEQPAPEPPAAVPEPVQRKRPARTAPAEPAGDPEPMVDTLPEAPPAEPQPDADGVIDAEVVEEQAMPSWQEKGLRVVHMHWNRLEADAAHRYGLTAQIVGRDVPITSHKELAQDELRHLIGVLEKARDLEALRAQLGQKEADDA